jgi:AcrR family transcriptional regulator
MRPRSFTDEELLDAARRVFLEHGPGASTSLIAQELGVSQPALFRRVRTKQELMLRSLIPRELPWVAELERGPDERPVPVQLDELSRKIDAFMIEQMPCISVLSAAGIRPEAFIETEGETWPGHRAHEAMLAWFTALADQGRIVAPSPRALATAFQASLQVPHFMKHALGKLAPDLGDDYRERVLELFWRAIAPRPDDDATGDRRPS